MVDGFAVVGCFWSRAGRLATGTRAAPRAYLKLLLPCVAQVGPHPPATKPGLARSGAIWRMEKQKKSQPLHQNARMHNSSQFDHGLQACFRFPSSIHPSGLIWLPSAERIPEHLGSFLSYFPRPPFSNMLHPENRETWSSRGANRTAMCQCRLRCRAAGCAAEGVIQKGQRTKLSSVYDADLLGVGQVYLSCWGSGSVWRHYRLILLDRRLLAIAIIIIIIANKLCARTLMSCMPPFTSVQWNSLRSGGINIENGRYSGSRPWRPLDNVGTQPPRPTSRASLPLTAQ
jgi:hypothetical protein